jgi:hypothetical protein
MVRAGNSEILQTTNLSTLEMILLHINKYVALSGKRNIKKNITVVWYIFFKYLYKRNERHRTVQFK